MAGEFIRAGIISDMSLVYELPESSTVFLPMDKAQARKELRLPADGLLFLWVGRLNANKDPLTALKAFSPVLKGQCTFGIVHVLP